MAGDFQGLALEKAEFLSGRLKEVLSSGQEYIRVQLGVDLGLKPEFYPTWVVLVTAAVGLLLLLGLSWAAVCGGLLLGKKRGSPVTQNRCEPEETIPPITKPEERKKRNRKKTSEKKTQLNVAVAPEAQVTVAVSKVASEIKTEKTVAVSKLASAIKTKKTVAVSKVASEIKTEKTVAVSKVASEIKTEKTVAVSKVASEIKTEKTVAVSKLASEIKALKTVAVSKVASEIKTEKTVAVSKLASEIKTLKTVAVSKVASEIKTEKTAAVSKLASEIKTEKVNEVQVPVQVKKSKKKNKTDVKPLQHNVITKQGKETDDGAWETKVSNREKKRRKDKSSEDSGSPARFEVPKSNKEAPVAPASTNTKKSKGNQVSSGRREEPSVNGGDLSDVSLKLPGQRGATEGNKWRTNHTPTHNRAPAKSQPWAQETKAWGGIDGQIKTDISSVSFTMVGRNTTEPISNTVELQWGNKPGVEDEWSGFNGVTAVDSCSDWSAPAEHWGNYEGAVVTPAPPPTEQPLPNKGSADEKDTEDPSGGVAPSKRKRKKKKTEEDGASEAQTVNLAPQELPAPTSKKLNPSISSSNKKPEKIAEPPKTSQKRKVRRET